MSMSAGLVEGRREGEAAEAEREAECKEEEEKGGGGEGRRRMWRSETSRWMTPYEWIALYRSRMASLRFGS
jgi:hypothetical protein